MLQMVLPRPCHREDVQSFYREMEQNGDECIGFANRNRFDLWLTEMQNRHLGKDLPAGYVRENFYLCYEEEKLIGVCSLKFALTDFLLQYGGQFWLAIENGRVIGTIGLMRKEKDCAVLKKFFVKREYRAQGIGGALYCALLAYAKAQGIKQIFLDTPLVAHASHRFYERAGFRKIDAGQLPVAYSYPDRDSLLYLLDL